MSASRASAPRSPIRRLLGRLPSVALAVIMEILIEAEPAAPSNVGLESRPDIS